MIIISWKIPARLFTGLCVDHTMYSCEAKRCEPAHIWLYLHYDAETVSRTIESFGYFKEQDHPAMFTLIIEEPATELSSFHSNSSSGITLKTCRLLQNLGNLVLLAWIYIWFLGYKHYFIEIIYFLQLAISCSRRRVSVLWTSSVRRSSIFSFFFGFKIFFSYWNWEGLLYFSFLYQYYITKKK